MTLIKEGIITALLLVIVGVGGYYAGGASSWTALIPAIIGGLIFISSIIAKINLKAGMHMAALFSLLGFLPLGRLIPKAIKDGVEVSLPFLSQVATVVICAVFLSLCIKSFKLARRAKSRELMK